MYSNRDIQRIYLPVIRVKYFVIPVTEMLHRGSQWNNSLHIQFTSTSFIPVKMRKQFVRTAKNIYVIDGIYYIKEYLCYEFDIISSHSQGLSVM